VLKTTFLSRRRLAEEFSNAAPLFQIVLDLLRLLVLLL
jgi:hypothetical protein